MTKKFPFNKDNCTIGQGKDALEALDEMFQYIDRFINEDGELKSRDLSDYAQIAGYMIQVKKYWQEQKL